MNTEELLLKLLGDLNQNMRDLTSEVHQLRTDLRLAERNQEQSYLVLSRRADTLEAWKKIAEPQLEELKGVAEVAKQIKKWAIGAFAAGLVLAAIAAVVLIPLIKALPSG